MIEKKLKAIREFCLANANADNVKKYSRYFKEGFESYGIPQKVYEAQRDAWMAEWQDHMTIDLYLELGDRLMQQAKYEEKSFAISLITSQRSQYTEVAFDRIGMWFGYGINNWATTDVLCMLVLPPFFLDKVIPLKKLKTWTVAPSEWQRRAVPVTLVELVKTGLTLEEAIPLIEPLMCDSSEYVQKGIGTLLRGLWKKEPDHVERFLMKWKDRCGRLIVQYATEKMDKTYRQRFRREKKV